METQLADSLWSWLNVLSLGHKNTCGKALPVLPMPGRKDVRPCLFVPLLSVHCIISQAKVTLFSR